MTRSFQLISPSSGDFGVLQHFILWLKCFAKLTPEMRVMTGGAKGGHRGERERERKQRGLHGAVVSGLMKAYG